MFRYIISAPGALSLNIIIVESYLLLDFLEFTNLRCIYMTNSDIVKVLVLQVQFRLVRQPDGERRLVALRDLNPGQLIFSEVIINITAKPIL